MISRKFAKKLRIETLKMTHHGKSSHIGSILSIIDIVAVLYCRILKLRPGSIKNNDRNRFILSKGHAGAAVYAALAFLGFFSKKKLMSHCKNGSNLSGHISHINLPGVEFSTGSLGHGLSVGCGFAFASKLKKEKSKTFVLLSDGECNEGSTWEAAMFAGHHKLKNLVAIIDYNKLQSLTTTTKTLNLEPFKKKWESFGWDCKLIDGHNHKILEKNFSTKSKNKPKCFIASTIKGKGVSFMENKVLWHYRSPNILELKKALEEVKNAR